MPPLISICLPNLNNRRFLEPRMESILAQTLTDWELIVCDSHSKDGAWEFFQTFAGDPRIHLHQVPREGIYAGWNECLRRATGKYIYIATSDDTMTPDCLEKLAAALESEHREPPTSNLQPPTLFPNLQPSTFNLQPSSLPPLPADIAVCNFDYIDEQGRVIDPPLPPAGAVYGDDRFRAHRRSGYLEFLTHVLIGTAWTTMTAVLFRRSLLKKTGLFREDVPGALADRLWAYRSAVFSDTIVVPETLATWRQHADQGSAPRQRDRDLAAMCAKRALWRATVETVRECVTLLPEDWRRDPGLLEKILWVERRHYYDHYHLSRTDLRHHPRRFMRGMAHAAVLESAYLMQRLAAGLAWSPDHDLSEEAYLRRFLSEL